MNCTVLFTANAGFFLTVDDITLCVDAFPRLESRGFSALSLADFETLCRCPALGQTRYVIATHSHPDHYSRRRTVSFLASHPGARFIGPEKEAQLLMPPLTQSLSQPSVLCAGSDQPSSAPVGLCGERPTYYFPGLTLEFARLTHEGEEFSSVPNYGCLLTTASGCRILFPGDAKPADPAIADWISGRSVDLALLNFPWITLTKGRNFLDRYIAPGKIALLHLPGGPSRTHPYLQAACKAAAAYRPEDTVLLTHFGQTVSF